MSYSLFIVAWAFIIICDAVNKFSISEWILYIQLTTLVLLNLTLIAQTALTVRLMSIVSERMGQALMETYKVEVLTLIGAVIVYTSSLVYECFSLATADEFVPGNIQFNWLPLYYMMILHVRSFRERLDSDQISEQDSYLMTEIDTKERNDSNFLHSSQSSQAPYSRLESLDQN